MSAPKVIFYYDTDPTRCQGLGRMCSRCRNHGQPIGGAFFCHIHADQREWMLCNDVGPEHDDGSPILCGKHKHHEGPHTNPDYYDEGFGWDDRVGQP